MLEAKLQAFVFAVLKLQWRIVVSCFSKRCSWGKRGKRKDRLWVTRWVFFPPLRYISRKKWHDLKWWDFVSVAFHSKAPPKEVPKTIENQRVYDETTVDPGDEEVPTLSSWLCLNCVRFDLPLIYGRFFFLRSHLMKPRMSFLPISTNWQTLKFSSQRQTDPEGWVASAAYVGMALFVFVFQPIWVSPWSLS